MINIKESPPRKVEGNPETLFMQCNGIVQGYVVILEKGAHLPDGVRVTTTVEQEEQQEPAEVTDKD